MILRESLIDVPGNAAELVSAGSATKPASAFGIADDARTKLVGLIDRDATLPRRRQMGQVVRRPALAQVVRTFIKSHHHDATKCHQLDPLSALSLADCSSEVCRVAFAALNLCLRCRRGCGTCGKCRELWHIRHCQAPPITNRFRHGRRSFRRRRRRVHAQDPRAVDHGQRAAVHPRASSRIAPAARSAGTTSHFCWVSRVICRSVAGA